MHSARVSLVVIGVTSMVFSLIFDGIAYGPPAYGKRYSVPNKASRIITFGFGVGVVLLGLFGNPK